MGNFLIFQLAQRSLDLGSVRRSASPAQQICHSHALFSVTERALPLLQLPANVSALIVEMERTRGDPVLMLIDALAGEEAGALPSVLDFGNYSDTQSYQERLNQHQITLLRPKAGLCAPPFDSSALSRRGAVLYSQEDCFPQRLGCSRDGKKFEIKDRVSPCRDSAGASAICREAFRRPCPLCPVPPPTHGAGTCAGITLQSTTRPSFWRRVSAHGIPVQARLPQLTLPASVFINERL